MPIEIRRAAAGDRPALARLFAAAFGAAPDPAEWEWKYDRNPFRAVSVIAADGAEAVGFFGGLATRYRGAEGAFPGVAGVDVMTAPSARRLGGAAGNLYREMGEAFVRENRTLGVPFYFGFPNDRHRVIGERLLGFRTVEKAGEWSRPLAGLARRSRLSRALLRSARPAAFGGEHAPLAEALHARPGWRNERSAESLNWRFAARPGVAYHLLELLDLRGRSVAYAVQRAVGDRALLVDLQLLDETSGPLQDLVREAAGLAASLGAARLSFRASGFSPLPARLVAELGFAREESDTSLEIVPVDPAFDLARALSRFDYRFGDHEVF